MQPDNGGRMHPAVGGGSGGDFLQSSLMVSVDFSVCGISRWVSLAVPPKNP